MPCNMSGDCCRLFLINLSPSEYHSRTYQTVFEEYGHIHNFDKAQEIGAHFLAKNPDGSCIYLEHNKCRIHARRPQVCRPFCCDSKAPQFKDMIDQVHQFRRVSPS